MSRDSYVEKLASALDSSPESDAEFFVDSADALLRWKTAGIPFKIGPKHALHNATTRVMKQSKKVSRRQADLPFNMQPPPQVKTAEADPRGAAGAAAGALAGRAAGKAATNWGLRVPEVHGGSVQHYERLVQRLGPIAKAVGAAGGGYLGYQALKKREKKEKNANVVSTAVRISRKNVRGMAKLPKTANMKAHATKALRYLKKNPIAGQAALWGTAGMAQGAVMTPGDRLGGAVRSGLGGAAGGAAAGTLLRAMNKVGNAYNERGPDPLDVAADRLPERGLPQTPLDQDIDDIKNSLLGAVKKYREAKTTIVAGPKQPKRRLPRPPKEVLEGLVKAAGAKDALKFLKDPATLTLMGLGGAIGGGGIYAASKPRKKLEASTGPLPALWTLSGRTAPVSHAIVKRSSITVPGFNPGSSGASTHSARKILIRWPAKSTTLPGNGESPLIWRTTAGALTSKARAASALSIFSA